MQHVYNTLAPLCLLFTTGPSHSLLGALMHVVVSSGNQRPLWTQQVSSIGGAAGKSYPMACLITPFMCLYSYHPCSDYLLMEIVFS